MSHGGLTTYGGAHGLATGRSGLGGRGFAMNHGRVGHGFRHGHFRRGFGYGGLYGYGGDWSPDYDYGYCSPYYSDPYGNCYGYGW